MAQSNKKDWRNRRPFRPARSGPRVIAREAYSIGKDGSDAPIWLLDLCVTFDRDQLLALVNGIGGEIVTNGAKGVRLVVEGGLLVLELSNQYNRDENPRTVEIAAHLVRNVTLADTIRTDQIGPKKRVKNP